MSNAWTIAAMMLAGCTVGDGDRSGFGGVPADDGTPPAVDSDGPDASTSGGEGEDAGEPSEPEPDPSAEYIAQAKQDFPTYLDLHEKVVTRTCSPNGGVCHNEKEYPDLHTPQTMLTMLDAPCNLAETEPLNLFDGCEPQGDELVFTTGSNTAYVGEVAWIELVADPMGVVTHATVNLREPIPNAMMVPDQLESIAFRRATEGGMLTVGAVDGAVSYTPGSLSVQINGYAELPAAVKIVLESDVRAGDPNQNGTFGYSEDEYRLLLPGDPWKSYLLQRLQGNVPGSPMPLANQPLSAPEIIALACWIEGATTSEAASPYASIDYDGCEYAAEFGETPTGSGATFSGHVQPIFEARCAAAGCHGAVAPAAGLDLTKDGAYESLMQAALQNPDMPRVTPGNPSNSYLITKLTGNGLTGVQMPLASQPLSEDELGVVRTWISYGAPND